MSLRYTPRNGSVSPNAGAHPSATSSNNLMNRMSIVPLRQVAPLRQGETADPRILVQSSTEYNRRVESGLPYSSITPPTVPGAARQFKVTQRAALATEYQRGPSALQRQLGPLRRRF